MYKLTNTTSIIRLADNATIPADEANTDYQSYLSWVAGSNTPEPLPAPTFEQIALLFEQGIQSYMDTEAQAKGYDNILSACTYAYPNNPFQAEATSFVIWRSAVWAYCYQELAKVQAGTRPMPTLEKIISELPARQ